MVILPIAIVVTVFNRPLELRRALHSIAAQDLQPVETIVIDDGSDEAISPDPELTAQTNVRLIRHDRNRGAAAARNTGMQAARTDWISFLDSDDYLLPGSLSTRMALVAQDQTRRADPRILYGCGWAEITQDGRPLALRWPRPSSDPVDFASGCWFSPGSCLIFNRKAALEAVGPQDESLRRYEDIDWFLALALKGFSICALPMAGVAVERCRSLDPEVAETAVRAVCEKWRGKQLDHRLLRRLEAYLALEMAAANHYAHRPVQALQALVRSFLKKPRTRLHMSPGWDVEPLASLPENSIVRGQAFSVDK